MNPRTQKHYFEKRYFVFFLFSFFFSKINTFKETNIPVISRNEKSLTTGGNSILFKTQTFSKSSRSTRGLSLDDFSVDTGYIRVPPFRNSWFAHLCFERKGFGFFIERSLHRAFPICIFFSLFWRNNTELQSLCSCIPLLVAFLPNSLL